MSAEEILGAYRNIPQAVSWVELFVCVAPPDSPETTWDMMMRCSVSMDEVIAFITDAVQGETQDPENSDTEKQMAAKVLEQMKHPEFRAYIAGKMGIV